jgi:hypothetical protein
MTSRMKRTQAWVTLAAAGALATAAVLAGGSHAAADQGRQLTGLFRITDGRCSASQTEPPSGSYFGMLAGKSLSGPFVANGSSADASGPCANKNYTPMVAGADGGLRTGAYQPNPDPAFDAAGNAQVSRIIKPVTWFGTAFGLSTQATDPQTGTKVPAPSITDTGGKLSGNLSAVDAAWNASYFNQGAPKPDGTLPGSTASLTGTIGCDGKYSMTWATTVIGGAFNNFTGAWHLTGTFEPSSGTVAEALGCAAPAAAGSGSTGGGGFPAVAVVIAITAVVVVVGGGLTMRARMAH